MIITKIIIRFIQIRHTDDFPSTGTRLVYDNTWQSGRFGRHIELVQCGNGATCDILDIVKKGSFYIAQYPVRCTAQSALHFLPSLTDLFIPTPFSACPGSILAMQQLRATTKSRTFPPLSIARYSFIQLSRQGRQWREGKCPLFQTVAKGLT